MSKIIWQKSNNFFIGIAKSNMSKFVSLARKIMMNLKNHISDPVIEAIHNEAQQDMYELELLYSSISSDKNNRKGNVMSFSNKMLELKDEKLPQWEGAIVQFYPTKSPVFSIILPSGRTGFNKGKSEKRIQNLKVFRDELAKYPDLSAVYTEVNTFYDDLVILYHSKENKKNDVGSVSNDLSYAANKMAIRLFKIWGLLSAHYSSTPDYLVNFFPVSYLRRKKKSKTENQNSMKLNLAVNEIAEAGVGFNINDLFLLSLINGSSIKVWFAENKDLAVIPANAVEINEYEEAEIEVKNYAGNNDRFMMIANASATEQAVVEITLLDKM